MSELIGNWKTRDRDFGRDTLLGKGILAGSYGGGAGAQIIRGGLVAGSINALNSVMSITAYEAMSAFFGSGLFGSGYKITPLNVNNAYGSIAYKVYATGSIQGSIVCFIPMALTIAAGVTASTYTASYARGASISGNFMFFGFIVSVP